MPLPTKSALVVIGWLADQDAPTLLQIATSRGLTHSQCESLAEMSQALLAEDNALATLSALPREELQTLRELSQGKTPPSLRSRWLNGACGMGIAPLPQYFLTLRG